MARWQRNPVKERQWRQLIARWQRSGQTIRDFCSRFQLSEPSFYAWRRMLAERDRAAASFVPVRVVADAAPPPIQPIELVLGSGRALRIGPGFDPQTLQQLLTLLESQPC
jgi:transposase